ncbi:MAG: four helix bundle protein [Saprospiraceae bacterium]|nr:four helix bundle protein [Saprospiraceae bacterium]
MFTYNFEKLDIWKISMELAVSVYKITDDFPSSEKFGLINQLRRASSSISANIAEGMSRGGKDRARFIQVAFGSSIEVLNFLILSEKVGFINLETLENFRLQILELTNKLNAFHKQIDK